MCSITRLISQFFSVILRTEKRDWVKDRKWKVEERLAMTKIYADKILCSKHTTKELHKKIKELNSDPSLLNFCFCVIDCGTFREDESIVIFAAELLSKIYPYLTDKQKKFIVTRIDQMITYSSMTKDQIIIRRHGGTIALTLLINRINDISREQYSKWAQNLINTKHYEYVAERGRDIYKLL